MTLSETDQLIAAVTLHTCKVPTVLIIAYISYMQTSPAFAEHTAPVVGGSSSLSDTDRVNSSSVRASMFTVDEDIVDNKDHDYDLDNDEGDDSSMVKATFEFIENVPQFSNPSLAASYSNQNLTNLTAASAQSSPSSSSSSASTAAAFNSPFYYQVKPVINKPIFFKATNFNVQCGEYTLFSDEGFSFDLRPGEIMTIEGESLIG